jgi:plasmid stabilization system protein ParE
MKFRLLVRKSVSAEAAKIYSFRENEKSGSGERFLEALTKAYQEIRANPFKYPVQKREYRRILLPRLKYRVVYRIKGDTIYVVQVRHTSQKPSVRYGP